MRRFIACALATTFLFVASGAAFAEVAGRPRGDGRVDTLIMDQNGITDGIDPIPQNFWKPFRTTLPPGWILNAPHVVFHRLSSIPVVVWAYSHGETHDIVFSYWTGDGWSPIEFITSTPQNEIDPRAYLRADGTLYVTWCLDGAVPGIQMSVRDPDGSLWSPPVSVTNVGEAGTHPTIAVHGGSAWIAYQRPATVSTFNTNEIVVRRQGQAGPFVVEFVADTEYDESAEPVLHVQNGRFWMDWRYSEEAFAYAEIMDPTGEDATIESWTDPSWVGVETVRRLIARIVAGNPLPVEDPPGQLP